MKKPRKGKAPVKEQTRSTIQTSIHIPDELRKRLRIQAIREDSSVSQIIVKLVEDYLSRRDGER